MMPEAKMASKKWTIDEEESLWKKTEKKVKDNVLIKLVAQYLNLSTLPS